MNKVDYRLNALVDASLGDVAPLSELALAAALNGATILQYRDKHGSTREMIENARAIHEAIAGTGVPLVINDRVDVALASGADGVHLGADDMDARTARRILGEKAIIGLTVKNRADAERAASMPADYACIGGVFDTVSKVNPDKPVGIDGFSTLRGLLREWRPDMPVGAIAGIDLSRVPSVIAAGADGVAVISAIFRAADIAGATKEFRSAIDATLKARQP
ncbi:thiamine phosphate synthase [Agrobacterium sp. CMT1]|jgi:thiamine-phosphate pyrophosphorylase|uniref:thiamine phosphate synthase n=1 Tax=Agrobacterium TaxID=357 RepID=UPI0005EE04FE|nr:MULTISPECIES: thiamine phosphate synthase [Agrobacterium]MBB2906802.1 thiamine-phosphate pyrophosphorylase [Rhizobium sp. RAS22]MBM7322139.1 thiamine phosphate synthase [Agrobacterium sp. S2]MBW9059644.1 thiamine phosphate synthase [Agrobacterium pusense]MCJ2876141.1 thiamine phosphate synthase [Agrobacterium pusense]MCW8280166.1 thiamine phosphate synthase [Agrobacterium sp. InxBP2]